MWNFLTKWDFFKVLVSGYTLVSACLLAFMVAKLHIEMWNFSRAWSLIEMFVAGYFLVPGYVVAIFIILRKKPKMWSIIRKWDILRVIVVGYTLVSMIILVMSLFGRTPEAGGGEVVMVMTMLSMPSSYLTGMFLNYIDYMSPPIISSLPGRAQLFMVWFPFFLGGLLQWGAPYMISRLLTKNHKIM